MAERYANFFEVGVRQLEQNFRVDFVFAERSLVLSETEAPQPIPNFHSRTCTRLNLDDGPWETGCLA